MSDRARVKVLPPFIPLGALAAGLVAHALAPRPIGPDWLVRTIGFLFIALSIAVVVTAARELARHTTPFDVRRTTTALVTTGIYRFTRNPVCLAMMALVSGVALSVNSLYMVLLALPAGSALCVLVIRPEEEYLLTKFGTQYLRYQERTRRWV